MMSTSPWIEFSNSVPHQALIRADRFAEAPKTPPVASADPVGSRATENADPGGSHEEAAIAKHVDPDAVGKVVDPVLILLVQSS